MNEIIEKFKKIDKFLEIVRTIDNFEHCHTVYNLFEIKNKNAPYSDVEKNIDKLALVYQRKTGRKYEILVKSIGIEAENIKEILRDHRREYNDYLRLNDPRVKQLRLHFDFCTKHDDVRELDSEEKDNLVKEGKALGFAESDVLVYIDEWVIEMGVREVDSRSGSPESPPDYGGKTYYEILGIDEDADYAQIKDAYDREKKKYYDDRDKAKASARFYVISEAWDCLKDQQKKREYDEKLKQPKTDAGTGTPKLVVECKSDYTFRDIRRGAAIDAVTIVIRNPDGGWLQGTIKSDVPWLEPDRNKILEKHEQKLYINVLTSKIPANTYDSTGNITIDTNGGPPYSISFRVILEGLEIATDRFRKTYVPLIAACAGFIGSFGASPFSNFLIGAFVLGIIAFAFAKPFVKFFFNEGIDIFKMPPVLIQGAAAGVVILTIMAHSGDNAAVRHYDNPISDPARASAPAPAPDTTSLNITKAVVAAGADTNNVAFGIDTSFSPGNKTLHYNITYDGGIANQTVFFFKWFKSGNLISESQFTLQYPSGWVDSKLNYDFQPGQYEVQLHLNGRQLDRTSFMINANNTEIQQLKPRFDQNGNEISQHNQDEVISNKEIEKYEKEIKAESKDDKNQSIHNGSKEYLHNVKIKKQKRQYEVDPSGI